MNREVRRRTRSPLKKSLPSGRFLGVALPLFIGATTSIYLLYAAATESDSKSHIASIASTATEKDESAIVLDIAQVLQKELDTRDVDGDGLARWEEILWRTDPDNPDTDGDGVPDGTEVKEGRDPTKVGPNDYLVEEKLVTSVASGGGADAGLSRTEEFSRRLFASYLELKRTGEYDQEKDDLVGSLIQTSVFPVVFAHYSTDDFAMIDGATIDDVKAYFTVMEGVDAILRRARTDDMVLLYAYLFERRFSSGEQLSFNIKQYETAETLLASTRVPREALHAHHSLTNALANYRGIMTLLQHHDKDPLSALLGLQQYQLSLVTFTTASEALRGFFISKGLLTTATSSKDSREE